MFSDLPASAILASHNTDIEPMEVNTTKPSQTTFSTGLKWVSVEELLLILSYIKMHFHTSAADNF